MKRSCVGWLGLVAVSTVGGSPFAWAEMDPIRGIEEAVPSVVPEVVEADPLVDVEGTLDAFQLDGDLELYDVAPCGTGNGKIDVDDILAMLSAFTGFYGCSCPGGGGSGWGLTGNAGTNPATQFIGTTDNVAFNVRVNNVRVMRYEPDATSPNVIGGSESNEAFSGIGVTIGGGGGGPGPNKGDGNFTTVVGGVANLAQGRAATVCGGEGNWAGDIGAEHSFVGGGKNNLATGNRAIVGGGENNFAGGDYSTIGGGGQTVASQGNTASGTWSTVGGGTDNTANGTFSTVGGGGSNTASEVGATVSGGAGNAAGGVNSTIPGGFDNVAIGDYSFAAGTSAKANHDGAFVWADSTFVDFASTAANQFLIRAAGGVGIGTNNVDTKVVVEGNESALHGKGAAIAIRNTAAGGATWYLRTGATSTNTPAGGFSLANDSGYWLIIGSTGNVGINRSTISHPVHVGTNGTNGNGAHVTIGGAWTNGSSREWKQNFQPIDKQEMLRKVVDLPVTQWQYKGEDESVRHIGPVAEEFGAAFGVGHDEHYITTIDADGVALAAIQGLHQLVQEKDCELDELRDAREDLQWKNAELDARLTRIERALAAGYPVNP